MKLQPVVVFLIFVVSGASFAQKGESKVGRIYGYVHNASKDLNWEKSGVSGIKVVLHTYVDGKEVGGEWPHTVTDAKGRFEFTGLQVGKRFAYYPATVFEGVEYYGTLVRLSADTTSKQSDVHAFESTRSDSSISIAMQHLVITPNQGNLHVREVYVFANEGHYTFVGSVPAGSSNKRIVLPIVTPEKATDVQFGGDLMSCCAITIGNRIYDTMEFKPGVRQIEVSYLLPYRGSKAMLTKEVTHATANLDVFLPEETGTLETAGFKAEATFTIRGENYQRYAAESLEAGSVLTLTFLDLPSAPVDLRWLAPLILAVLVIGGFFLRRYQKRKESKTAPASHKKAERQRLLHEILQLDDAFAAGNVGETDYLMSREKLKKEVLALEGSNGESSAAEAVETREVNHAAK